MGVLGGLLLKPVVTTGLIAEYLANNNFLDTSGNGYNGVNNNVTFGDDRNSNPNSAFVLNGTTAFVDIDAALAGLSSNTKGTFSIWVKPVDATPPTAERLISFGDADANEFLTSFIQSDGKASTAVGIAGTTQWVLRTSGSFFLSDVWKHFAIVQDGISAILYIDGIVIGQSFANSTDKTKWFNDATNLDTGRIGAINFNSGGDSGFFEGSLDDIRLYDRALSEAEIITLSNE